MAVFGLLLLFSVLALSQPALFSVGGAKKRRRGFVSAYLDHMAKEQEEEEETLNSE